jgi:hypothetical protein
MHVNSFFRAKEKEEKRDKCLARLNKCVCVTFVCVSKATGNQSHRFFISQGGTRGGDNNVSGVQKL